MSYSRDWTKRKIIRFVDHVSYFHIDQHKHIPDDKWSNIKGDRFFVYTRHKKLIAETTTFEDAEKAIETFIESLPQHIREDARNGKLNEWQYKLRSSASVE